jgi:hypothetical protein
VKNVLIKINGIVQNPVMDWMNDAADHFIQWETGAAAHGLLWSVGGFCKMLAPMIPEIAVFSIMVLITIGMFTDFPKWLARSLLVFVGAVVWLTLAHI